MLNGKQLKPVPGRAARLMEYVDAEPAGLELDEDMAWLSNVLGPVPRGTVMLLSGDPGVGKSTLALQVAASAEEAGERSLYISTEQSGVALEKRLNQLAAMSFVGMNEVTAVSPVPIVDDLGDLRMLSGFLARQVFHPAGRFRQTTLIVIDSLQGRGISASDRGAWQALYEFFRTASAAGISILAVAHMTKSHQIAGPRTLEHQVDVVVNMRHGITSRALTVPKNRNYASRMDPLLLTMHPETTRMIPSPLSESSTARARSIAAEGVVEIEAAVVVPRHDRGYVKAPGLSIKEVETVVDLLQRTVPACRHLDRMGVTVRAPDGIRQRRDHNLAIAAAILAAVTRKHLPENAILIGDLTLQGEVRAPSVHAQAYLDDLVTAGLLDEEAYLIARDFDSADHPAAGLATTLVSSINDICSLLENGDE